MFLDGYSLKMSRMNIMSIEHIVPKSKLPKYMKWDLHNLMLTDHRINSKRGDLMFASRNIRNVSFYPENNKGFIARTCAHMISECMEDDFNIKTNKIIHRDTMLKWNELYPVSDTEKYVNEYIYSIQGNYNKYIDDGNYIYDRIEKLD